MQCMGDQQALWHPQLGYEAIVNHLQIQQVQTAKGLPAGCSHVGDVLQ
jgi:hypothetical protein